MLQCEKKHLTHTCCQRGRPTNASRKEHRGGKSSAYKQSVLRLIDGGEANWINLLKLNTGESLEPPAVRIVLVYMLHLYAEAARDHAGPIEDIPLFTTVYAPTATTHHISQTTAERIFVAWMESAVSQLSTSSRPEFADVQTLLEGICTPTPRGPSALPVSTTPSCFPPSDTVS